MKDEVQARLSAAFGERVEIESSQGAGGGCINQAQVLTLRGGRRVFLKSNPHPPAGMFSTEARGLELLGRAGEGPRVPKVIALQEGDNPKFLILEFLEAEPPCEGFYRRFGRALAALHRVQGETFGLDHDNFIGSTVQVNTPETDGLLFFRDHRLGFQQALARKNRLLPAALDHRLDTLRDRLEDFLDLSPEPPSLIHGDLWSGNHFAGTGQAPVILDPAAHFGWREADLAMTELFGRLPQDFYAAYQEAYPLPPGYEERKKIYNLYHLLNHLNLFGGSYLGSVESTVNHCIR
ncbi:MAG: fructosamine kinase family protein [Nitrospinaceae bacterium]